LFRSPRITTLLYSGVTKEIRSENPANNKILGLGGWNTTIYNVGCFLFKLNMRLSNEENSQHDTGPHINLSL
jgi:hypothetical protein